VGEVDAGGFAGLGAATGVAVDAGGFAGAGAATGVAVDAGGCAGAGVAGVVDPEACPALGAVAEVDPGVDAAVDATDVEVAVPAELVEPQPLSKENKGTNAARAGAANALAWNVMAAFSSVERFTRNASGYQLIPEFTQTPMWLAA
jgi:hypothetical protein